jgi:hypothetical protein
VFWHAPPLQTCEPLQAAQFPPPTPQAAVVLPGWHTLLASQHPLHVTLTHWLLVHCCLAEHTAHVAPPVPQAALVLPV